MFSHLLEDGTIKISEKPVIINKNFWASEAWRDILIRSKALISKLQLGKETCEDLSTVTYLTAKSMMQGFKFN